MRIIGAVCAAILLPGVCRGEDYGLRVPPGFKVTLCGDGWFSRYRDSKGRGEADGPPEHFVPLHFGEHGGHAMRRGPDGYWYVLGGNDSRFTRKEHATLPNSPIHDVEAG